ncbi:MAG: VanZ family protein [Crocinitomicaceae bacterium]|nr:VanZ family protein [Crocinitomicaceae bacterium]
MLLRVSLILIIIGIAYLSLTPTDTITIGNDKISHFIAYGALMTNIGMITYEKRYRFLWGIILALLYGALIEVGQHFVPGRFMSGMDMLANAGGVILGALITIFAYKPVRKLLSKTRII